MRLHFSTTLRNRFVDNQFSRSYFQKLGWIEGAWRGSADGGDAFYELYHFVNDTSIDIQFFGRDQTLSQIKRKGSVALVRGRILHRDGSAVWIATSIDDKSVHFAPSENADNFILKPGPHVRSGIRGWFCNTPTAVSTFP